jgi:hypothetical protein
MASLNMWSARWMVVWGCVAGSQLLASGLPPVIRAATSQNGQFLVVATLKLGPTGEGGGQSILGETFEVNERETFVHTKGRLTAPNGYYLPDFGWTVELPRQSGFIAPWPIISDDGLSLILVGVSPPVPGMTLLAIYKKHGRSGDLLRNYEVDKLWSLKPGEERMSGYTDGTPEWFDDGRFTFSANGETLLYADKKNGLLEISLDDGMVKECSVGKAQCGGRH